jgi:hypothetical protein
MLRQSRNIIDSVCVRLCVSVANPKDFHGKLNREDAKDAKKYFLSSR